MGSQEVRHNLATEHAHTHTHTHKKKKKTEKKKERNFEINSRLIYHLLKYDLRQVT